MAAPSPGSPESNPPEPDAADAAASNASTPDANIPERASRSDGLARGPRADSPGDLGLPEQLGDYRLLRVLGAGGMGTVVEATRRGKRYAIKVLHAHLAGRTDFAERFLREGRLGQQVTHPGVVPTLASGHEGPHHYLVMPYVEGRTLEALIDDAGAQPEALCRQIAQALARSLAAIHAADLVHRDLKPANVLLTPDHAVRLMDLGVALPLAETQRMSATGEFLGTVLYAAPEQLDPSLGPVGPASDLYGLGVLLYELAAGVHPFGKQQAGAMLLGGRPKRITPLGQRNPQISPFFEALVASLLERDPEARMSSAVLLAERLAEGERGSWWRELVGSLDARRAHRRLRVPRDTALYGRADALATLGEARARVESGTASAVFVVGEAGIGKSRLVDEFLLGWERESSALEVLWASYSSDAARAGEDALLEALARRLGADPKAALQEMLEAAPPWLATFADFLTGRAASGMDSGVLQTACLRTLLALAGSGPLVLVVEDLHFADAAGRTRFLGLARQLTGAPVLLIGTWRRSAPQDWQQEVSRVPAGRTLSLERLGPRDLGSLLEEAFRSKHLAEELAFKIATKSDGNPFFVFEMIRSLREARVLQREADGRWGTTRMVREIEVPSSVHDLIRARLQELAPEERNLLEAACCLGHEFDPLLAGRTLGLEPIPVLQQLAHIARTYRLVHPLGERFVFDHHQVQEVLYKDLGAPLATHLHGMIARLLIDGRPLANLEAEALVDVVQHALRGPMAREVVEGITPASHHLLRIGAVEAADDLLRRADTLREHIAPETAFAWSLATEEAARRGGDPERRMQALEQAESIARAMGDQLRIAQVAEARAFAAAHRNDNEVALALAERAVGVAQLAGADDIELRSRFYLAGALRGMGRHAAGREAHREALALAQAGDHTQAEIDHLTALSGCCCADETGDAVLPWLERALELSATLPFGPPRWRAANVLGYALTMDGQLARAEEQVRRAIAETRDHGDLPGQIVLERQLVYVHLQGGRLEEAELSLGHLRQMAEALDGARTLAICDDGEARVAAGRGDADRAVAAWQRADERLTALHDYDYLGIMLVDALDSLIGLGAWEAVLDAEQRLATVLTSDDVPSQRLRRGLARVRMGMTRLEHLAPDYEAVRTRIPRVLRLEIALRLAQLGGGAALADEARREMQYIEAHTAPEHREALYQGVPLFAQAQ